MSQDAERHASERERIAEAEKITGPCMCDPAYKDRDLIQPDCAYHAYAEEIAAVLADRDAERAQMEQAIRNQEPVLRAAERQDKALRELLWLRHGCLSLYGDDGEMQCGKCVIDFKRDTPGQIRKRFEQIGLAALLAPEGA
jgi:hypothetical protein